MENHMQYQRGKYQTGVLCQNEAYTRHIQKNTFPPSDLKKYGMGQFMVPMRANETILRYLHAKEKDLDSGDV